jgi:hypothetical protein
MIHIACVKFLQKLHFCNMVLIFCAQAWILQLELIIIIIQAIIVYFEYKNFLSSPHN